MRNYAGSRKGICSYYLMYTFLVQLLRLKSSVFMVIFLNAFWYGNEAFPKGSSQNEVATLLIVFHLPYTKHWGVKMFLLVSSLKSKFFARVAPVLFAQHSCRTHFVRVALASHPCHTFAALVSLSCHTSVALVWHSCRSCLVVVL